MSIADQTKSQLIQRFLTRKTASDAVSAHVLVPQGEIHAAIPEAFTRFDRHPAYEKILVQRTAADRLGLEKPFFITHEGVAGAVTRINGCQYINFASYNYLGLSGHPEVNKAAQDAIDRYGTSASASRLVAGERPIQHELEKALAALYGVEDCVVFVSGHATNVSTIATLFSSKDLVVHDALIHNSVLEGIKLAGSHRRSFPHNDLAMLDALLSDIRGKFQRVLIVVEGHYSMDGDLPDLPQLINIKRRHKAFLMVDEAHALGVLGKTGKGSHEHHGIAGQEIDIWMGTLSKTLAGCGGFIAGSRALVELLKYAASGFVYSVGIAPPLAAASLAALQLMQKEPERVAQLWARAQQFLTLAYSHGIDTGRSQGYAIIPVQLGSSLKAVRVSNELFKRGINVQPIIYPAVEEKSARLRFFISSMHSEEHIVATIEALKDLV